jgi:hypothetical protein
MAKWVLRAAAAGFVIGAFWCAMFFVFFTAEPHGPWWGLYFVLMLITCPAWFLGGFLGPLIPFGNAGIYALIAFCAYKLRESGRGAHAGDLP